MTKLIFLVLFLFGFSQIQAIIYIERDPFQQFDISMSNSQSIDNSSISTVSKSGSIVKLTGVIWEEEFPMAVVLVSGRRKILSVGDLIASKKVLRISKNAVWLKGKEKTLILKVGKEMRL